MTMTGISTVPLMDCMIRAQFIEILKGENIKRGLGKNIEDLTEALGEGCGELEWGVHFLKGVGTLAICAAGAGISHFLLSKVQSIALNKDRDNWLPLLCFASAGSMGYLALSNIVQIGLCHHSTHAHFLDMLESSDGETYEMGKAALENMCVGNTSRLKLASSLENIGFGTLAIMIAAAAFFAYEGVRLCNQKTPKAIKGTLHRE